MKSILGNFLLILANSIKNKLNSDTKINAQSFSNLIDSLDSNQTFIFPVNIITQTNSNITIKHNDGSTINGVSNNNGKYEILLNKPGTYTITSSKEGFQSSTQFTISPYEPLNIVLMIPNTYEHSTITPVGKGRQFLAASSNTNYVVFGGGSNTSELNWTDGYDRELIKHSMPDLSHARDWLSSTSTSEYIAFGGGNINTQYNLFHMLIYLIIH